MGASKLIQFRMKIIVKKGLLVSINCEKLNKKCALPIRLVLRASCNFFWKVEAHCEVNSLTHKKFLLNEMQNVLVIYYEL